MYFAETWMDDIASTLGIPEHKVREINFYKDGQLTHTNQLLENSQVSLTHVCF